MAEIENDRILRESAFRAGVTAIRERVYTREETEELLGEGGLSPWQKQYLEKLEDQEVKSKYAVTLAVSPASKEDTGSAVDLTLTATVKYNNAVVDAEIVSKDGLTFTKKSTGVYEAKASFAVPTNTNGSNSKAYGITAKYTLNGTAMGKDASATFTLYSQCVILQTEGTAAPTSAQILSGTNKRRGITGTYDVPVTAGRYVWLCVPGGLTGVTKITSSGFGVPFEAAQNVNVALGSRTVAYRCYRISGAPQSSPMSLVVS